MNTGQRLQTARKLRGMTQKELGLELGYQYYGADTRIAQYETGVRTPKASLIKQMAEVLQVNPKSITGATGHAPDDVIQFLFDLEEEGYDIEICKCKDEIIVKIKHPLLNNPLEQWKMMRAQLRADKLSKKEYQTWKFEWVIV